MTLYALLDGGQPSTMLAVWPAGHGQQAVTVCSMPEVTGDRGAQLCEVLTRLSEALWETYSRPDLTDDFDQDLLLLQERGEGFSRVSEALTAPHLPDAHGNLLVSYDPVIEWAHTAGRVLHAIGDATVTKAVVDDVQSEIAAVQHASRGELTGRAVQAVTIDHADPSPLQVAAADRLLHEHPLGDSRLWTTIDPAAACVAAAHWLAAAADATADKALIDATSVFSYADDIEAVSVEVPTAVVQAVLDDEAAPRHVVTTMLTEAISVAEGRVPDPSGLPDLIDSARKQVQQLQPRDRDEALAGLLERLTPLDPRRPSRDLLEHLLDGVNSCLLIYRDAVSDQAPLPDDEDDDLDEGIPGPLIDEFCDAVRQRATLTHRRVEI